MKKFFSALAALAIAATIGSVSARADDLIESWTIEGWEGGAYESFDTAEIYCSVVEDYGDGAFMWLTWDSAGFSIVLNDPNVFNLQPGPIFWTSMNIDDRYLADVEAYVIDSTNLYILLRTNRDAIGAIMSGEILYLQEWDVWYTLYGADVAIPALEDCYWNYN